MVHLFTITLDLKEEVDIENETVEGEYLLVYWLSISEPFTIENFLRHAELDENSVTNYATKIREFGFEDNEDQVLAIPLLTWKKAAGASDQHAEAIVIQAKKRQKQKGMNDT